MSWHDQNFGHERWKRRHNRSRTWEMPSHSNPQFAPPPWPPYQQPGFAFQPRPPFMPAPPIPFHQGRHQYGPPGANLGPPGVPEFGPGMSPIDWEDNAECPPWKKVKMGHDYDDEYEDQREDSPDAMATNTSTRKLRAQLESELRTLLTGKANGIPLTQLQAAYSRKFNRDLKLKACKLKLADVLTVFSSTFEGVNFNGKKCIKLKTSAMGKGEGDSKSGPSASASSKTEKKKSEVDKQQTQSSKKPVPSALTVPQYAFEPVPKRPPDEHPARKEKSEKGQRDIEHGQLMGQPVHMQNQPGQMPFNPLEYQMNQYIAGTFDATRMPHVGAHGGPHHGVHTLAGPPLGLLGAHPAGYIGGPLTVGDGFISFDQGSALGNQDTPKTNAAQEFSLDKYYDRKKEESTSSSQNSSASTASVAASQNVDSQNWPSLSDAKNTKRDRKSAKPSTAADGNKTKKPIPLVDLTGSSSAPRVSTPPQVHQSASKSTRNMNRTFYGRSRYPREQIDDYAQNCIANLSEVGDHVSIERVVTLVKHHFQVERIEELGLRREDDLECIRSMQRLQKKINASIQSFVKTRAIGTLHELHESLSALEKKSNFVEYNLGPLVKQPLIYDFFKFPNDKQDGDIPAITTMDILEVLKRYLTGTDSWRNRVKLEDFMQHVMTHYDVESPYELGIRIESVGLGISVLKTAQREQKQAMDLARKELKDQAIIECSTAMVKIRKALFTPLPDDIDVRQFLPTSGPGFELRKTYAAMSAGEAITAVFENICELIGRNQKLDRFVYHLTGVKTDPLASALFQLALCLGSLKPPEELGVDSDDDDDDDSSDDDSNQANQLSTSEGKNKQPTDEEVSEELKRYLDRLMQHGVPKLRDLASIEKRLCQQFGATSFNTMLTTHKTFLDFMADHPQVLQAFGGSLLGVGSNNPISGSPYRPSRMDIMEFIQQCDVSKRSPEEISSAMCSHYQISNVEELGQGQLAMMMKQSKKRHGMSTGGRPITYEAALCAGSRSCDQTKQQVGLLGTQSLERALGCLNSAPLLEDLAEWTHWDLVFKAEHGDLKTFIDSGPGDHLSPPVEIQAMETKPGVLLKLASHTSTDQFSAHAQKGDAINTAGHLVSLVMHDGIGNVPMALLGNHMESALAKILKRDMDAGRSLDEGQMLRFALDVLTRMPTQIACAISQQVILKPLSSVVGSETKSRALLLKTCKTFTEKSKLQRLGLLLGISTWKSSIEERLPTLVNDDDIYDDDDGEADIDVDSLLVAAASTPNVKMQKSTTSSGTTQENKFGEPPKISDDISSDKESKQEDAEQENDCSQVIDSNIQDDTIDISASSNVKTEVTDSEDEVVMVTDNQGQGRGEGDGAEEKECQPCEQTTSTSQKDAKTKDVEKVKTKVKHEEVTQTDKQGKRKLKEEDSGLVCDLTEEDKIDDDVEIITDSSDVEEVLDSSVVEEFVDSSVVEVEETSEVEELKPETEEPEPEPEPELSDSQRHIWNCKTVIDNVRHDEFGVGMQLDEQSKQLMQRHQERIGRSLQRLSEELYSKDTHFVLELIQNADDNKYDEGTEPSLVFVVDKESVTSMNNERGFSEQDIRALCDVGKSTKGKHKHGYIGHKGIGFKSVFRVTDCPEIHSSGYHVCFEHGKDPMGYILPTWIGPQDLYQLAEFQNKTDWATTIKLPLKGDLQQTSSLVNKFQDIQPSLLLFLHRLRSVVIVNKDEGNTRHMKRQDIGDNLIEIKHNKVTESWLVVKEQLDATKLNRERIESTELALAFPIKNSANISQNREQSVFAFLPLRSYGFHFIIQGDFDIPSSREDVDSDSAWNQWLQQNIAPIFVSSLSTFSDYYSGDPIQAVCNFLQFVPLEDQILTEFFKKVAVSIHQRLKATPCLPVVSENSEDVELKLPSETVMAKDPLVQDVVHPSVLKTHLNCHYLHQKVLEECSPTLLSSLGVKKLRTSDLISILNSVSVKANNTGDHLPVQTIAKWLACIYRCREREYDVSRDLLDQLCAIPIIPLASGRRVAIRDLSVFFPLSADDKVPGNDPRHFQTGSRVLKAVEADMAMVDIRLLHSLDDVGNSQIRRMLEELGVRHISPQEVIHHHILPILQSEEKWKSKTVHNNDVLIGYIVYIKEQWEKNASVCNIDTDLKPHVVVMTDHGPCNPAKSPVHFPKVYGNAIDLPRDLPGCDWVLLDACYLSHRGPKFTDRDLVSWQQFFIKLGVLWHLAVETKVVTYQESEMSSSPWADVYSYWPKPSNGQYKIKDQVCKEFEQLIGYNGNSDIKKQQRENLIKHLDQRWRDSYSKYMSAELLDNESSSAIRPIPSSFEVHLKSSAWLPCIADGNLQFKLAQDLFFLSQEMYNLLGPHVPYLTVNLPPDSLFLNFLSVRNMSCISPDFMIAMLKTWCHHKQDEVMNAVGHGAVFKTAVDHIVRVYQYLFENCRQKDLKELFDQHPAIFVPQEDGEPEEPVQGKFVHKKCTYWNDPTGFMQKFVQKTADSTSIHRFAIGNLYQNIKNILLGQNLIDHTPNLKEYVVLLEDMASEVTLPDNEKLPAIFQVYGVLGKKCMEISNKESSHVTDFGGHESNTLDSNSQSCLFLRELLQDLAVFPTTANKWITLANRPILCDDDSAEIEKLFSNNPCVHLLNMADRDKVKGRRGVRGGNNNKEMIKPFLEACEIKTLSECVEREFIPTLLQASPHVQLFLYSICPYIQRYISTQSQRDDNFNTLYQQLQDENMEAILKTMMIYQVKKLEVVHRMKHRADIMTNSIIECGMEKKALYVIQDVVPKLHKNIQVRREISKMFSRGISSCQKALFTFIGNLVLQLDLSNLGETISETLCSQLDLDPLEDDVNEWNVPKPVMPEIKKAPPPPPPVVVQPSLSSSRDQQTNENKPELEGDKGLISSWPPRSSAFGAVISKGPKKDEDGGLKMWPPPAPPTPRSPAPVAVLDGEESAPRTTHADGLQRQHSQPGRVSTPSDGGTSGSTGQTHPKTTDQPEGQRSHATQPRSNLGPQSQTLGDFVKNDQVTAGDGTSVDPGDGTSVDQNQDQIETISDGESVEEVNIDEQEVKDIDQDEVIEDQGNQDTAESDMSFHTPPSVLHTPGPFSDTPGSSHRGPSHGPNSGAPYTGQYDGPYSGSNRRPYYRTPSLVPPWAVFPSVEVEFEDVIKGDDIKQYTAVSEIPADLDELEGKMQTGRWGEELVYNYLLRTSREGVQVTWINEQKESGKPFDLVVDGEDFRIYVEVKSTKLDQKELFEISSKEIVFAEEHKENFHLYRVYNAGNVDSVRLCRLQNLSLKMDQKEVKLCMYI